MVPSRYCLLFPSAQIAQHTSICTINPKRNLNSRQNTTNIHLYASFLTESIYICMQPEKKIYIFCMQNRQVAPSLHREETTIFFCKGGREAFWKIHWVAANFPDGAETLTYSQSPGTQQSGHMRDKVCLCVKT